MGTLVLMIIIIAFIYAFSRRAVRGAKKKTGTQSDGRKAADSSRPDTGKKTAGMKRPISAGTMDAKKNVPPDRGRQERFDAYKRQKTVGQTGASEAYRRMKEADIPIVAEADAAEMRVRRSRETAEDADLMREVYDAIILGPKDTMAFRRDFVAEGMDFLNRYSF